MNTGLPDEIISFVSSCIAPGTFTAFFERAEKFRALLEEENRKINLTRIEGLIPFWTKHAADCLSALRFVPELKAARSIADIGCGAGFPSVPFAIAMPPARITAVDSTLKKIRFVQNSAAAIGLRNLSAFQFRACEMAHRYQYREYFDVITARAVGASKPLVHDTAAMLRKGGHFVLYKTPEQAVAELAELRNSQTEARIEWRLSDPFELPCGAGSRQFVCGRKT